MIQMQTPIMTPTWNPKDLENENAHRSSSLEVILFFQKKTKLVYYKDYSAVFPSPDASWETKGTTSSEKTFFLENTGENTRDEILVPNKCDKTKPKKREKLVLLPPCPNKCRQKCFLKITPAQRLNIFNYFIRLDYGERQLFFDNYVKKMT